MKRGERQLERLLAQAVLPILIAFVLAATTFVSTLCIAELFDHDCEGDGCEICLVLEVSQAALTTGAVASPIACLFALLLLAAEVLAAAPFHDRAASTPISLKDVIVV